MLSGTRRNERGGELVAIFKAGVARRIVACYPTTVNFNYEDYFERRVELCGGALVVKGTRVPVRTLLASLAEGASEAEVLKDFPTVTPEGLRAVIAFAAASAGDDLPVSPVPAVVA